jgi:hypothetical protein
VGKNDKSPQLSFWSSLSFLLLSMAYKKRSSSSNDRSLHLAPCHLCSMAFARMDSTIGSDVSARRTESRVARNDDLTNTVPYGDSNP